MAEIWRDLRYSKYSKMLIVEPRLWVVDIYIFTSLFQVFCMFKNFQNKILGEKKNLRIKSFREWEIVSSALVQVSSFVMNCAQHANKQRHAQQAKETKKKGCGKADFTIIPCHKPFRVEGSQYSFSVAVWLSLSWNQANSSLDSLKTQ